MAIIVWNGMELIGICIAGLVIIIFVILFLIEWIKNKINIYKKKQNGRI